VRRLRDYDGRVALVTGASSGIGRLLAQRFAARGARVGLLARRVEMLETLAEEIRAQGGEALAIACDVAEREQVHAAAERATAELGPVDLLVNNAGFGAHRSVLASDESEMERMLRVNFLGSLYFTKALLPGMVARGCGWLVFMASVAGRIATPGEAIYAATKFALVGFAEALSLEVEDAGVQVLTVCPGAIRTDFFGEEDLAVMPEVALRSMVEPEPLVDEIVRALAKGKRELTYPRGIAAGYVVRALAPGFMRTQVKRVTRKRDG
jgi:short-subunit dehydrogenase